MFEGPRVLDARSALCGVNVQRVDVALRWLAAVPEMLAGMERVTSLKVSWNPIVRSWEQLRSLPQLRELDLGGCGLTEVPAALASLESMTRLDLSLNGFKSGWERLHPPRQRELDLSYCKLTEVPEALIGMMESMTSLQLSGNHFEQLRSLKGMECMTSLDISGNHFEHGWEQLRSLPQLQVLDLSKCHLTELPEVLTSMESMKRLCISYNSIMRGWERLHPLRQLQELNLWCCNLTELPEALAGMESMTSLNLGYKPYRARLGVAAAAAPAGEAGPPDIQPHGGACGTGANG